MQFTPDALGAAYYSFSQRYQAGFDAAQPWSSEIATEVPSTTRENRYPWITQIPRMREWLGERMVHNLAARVTSIINKDWEDTVEVDRNDFEDDNLGVYAPVMQTLGYQARMWPDDMLVALLKAGATQTGFDGQPFFNSSHPLNIDNSGAGTYSNLFTGRPLTSANYREVRALMRVINDEQGRSLQVRPNLLMVPPQLEATAKEIVENDVVVSGGAAITNVMRGTARVLVVDEIADAPNDWYVLDVSKPIKPFIIQLRKAPQFVSLNSPTDQNVFWRKKFVFGVDARGNAGFGLPFLAAKVTAA
jgi:phage major head subunit gpT-like protein